MEREVIAVDTEGITHVEGTAQSPVIFGTSATPPLVDRDLRTGRMLRHVMEVAHEHPHALWVWYGSRYDADMIVKDLSYDDLRTLYDKGSVQFMMDGWFWSIRMVRGKWMDVSRCAPDKWAHGSRYQNGGTSVRIYDYASFFGKKFLTVCEELLRDELSAEDRETIATGKTARGHNTWADMPDVLYYWSREIQLIRRTFEKFRSVMNQAGFPLRDWYGPGAFARFLMERENIHPHLSGAQTHKWSNKERVWNDKLPLSVHEAVKRAFAGGRFEMFKAGRVQGPIYVPDINSAYPHALTMIPSLADDAGEWVWVDRPRSIERFGVYQIDYKVPDHYLSEYRPMPLFFRDQSGGISWPSQVSGWYMSPEARISIGQPGVTIKEGWVWRSKGEEVFPYAFLSGMYDTRMRLGKGNLLSLPFKLGPNSIYGKHAQTVGWNEALFTPPRYHAQAIAAWVTSYCRALLWQGMIADPSNVIAVETDSIVTTTPPDRLDIQLGSGMGEWSCDVYDEIIYVQSGMYFARKGDQWSISRSRGLDRADLSVEAASAWLETLVGDPDTWEPLQVTTAPRFQGLGYALAMSAEHGQSFDSLFRVWRRQSREIAMGDSGKRIHQADCPACYEKLRISEHAHPLAIHPAAQMEAARSMSRPRRLPWEQAYEAEVARARLLNEVEKDLVSA